MKSAFRVAVWRTCDTVPRVSVAGPNRDVF